MDVLQVIKEGHDKGRQISAKLCSSQKVQDRKARLEELSRWVDVQLRLESEYLMPELSLLLPNSEAVVDPAKLRHKQIYKSLKVVGELLAKAGPSEKAETMELRLNELSTTLSKHLEHTENEIMPKLRMLIPTADREDLGLQFKELKDEFEMDLSKKKSIPNSLERSGAKKRA